MRRCGMAPATTPGQCQVIDTVWLRTPSVAACHHVLSRTSPLAIGRWITADQSDSQKADDPLGTALARRADDGCWGGFYASYADCFAPLPLHPSACPCHAHACQGPLRPCVPSSLCPYVPMSLRPLVPMSPRPYVPLSLCPLAPAPSAAPCPEGKRWLPGNSIPWTPPSLNPPGPEGRRTLLLPLFNGYKEFGRGPASCHHRTCAKKSPHWEGGAGRPM